MTAKLKEHKIIAYGIRKARLNRSDVFYLFSSIQYLGQHLAEQQYANSLNVSVHGSEITEPNNVQYECCYRAEGRKTLEASNISWGKTSRKVFQYCLLYNFSCPLWVPCVDFGRAGHILTQAVLLSGCKTFARFPHEEEVQKEKAGINK